jgi:hypothetical protein
MEQLLNTGAPPDPEDGNRRTPTSVPSGCGWAAGPWPEMLGLYTFPPRAAGAHRRPLLPLAICGLYTRSGVPARGGV